MVEKPGYINPNGRRKNVFTIAWSLSSKPLPMAKKAPKIRAILGSFLIRG